MQPVTISRLQLPSVLCRAISRIVSIDSCLAESMNAQVLTTRTSASPASCVSSWPSRCASPSITSESTRLFGQPREIIPIFISPYSEGHGGHGDMGTWAHGDMGTWGHGNFVDSKFPCPHVPSPHVPSPQVP